MQTMIPWRTRRLLISLLVPLSLFITFLFFPVRLLRPDYTEETSPKRMKLIEDTVSALERLIDHFFEVGDGINLDGVFGIRVVEDQLQTFLDHVALPYESRTEHSRYTDLIERLVQMQKRAKQFHEHFTPIVKKNQPKYYKVMHFWLTDSTWDFWYPQRNVKRNYMPTYTYEMTVNDTITPEDSDECMVESYNNHCQISSKCWKRMTSPYHGFSLTHELIMIMSAMAIGCGKQVEISAVKFTHKTIDQLIEEECASVLHEAELIASRDYRKYRRDLFMEQAAICGIFGYRDFFRDDWIKRILNWQDQSGCFKLNVTETRQEYLKDFPNPNHLRRTRRANVGISVQPKPINVVSSADDQFETESVKRIQHRQKRNEVDLSDGCYAHMTTVASVAMSQYIRFFLEPFLTA